MPAMKPTTAPRSGPPATPAAMASSRSTSAATSNTRSCGNTAVWRSTARSRIGGIRIDGVTVTSSSLHLEDADVGEVRDVGEGPDVDALVELAFELVGLGYLPHRHAR